MSGMKKNLTATDIVSEKNHVESYPDFEKLAHVIEIGLQRFIVKNIEGDSTEANDLGHILYKRICCFDNSKVKQS